MGFIRSVFVINCGAYLFAATAPAFASGHDQLGESPEGKALFLTVTSSGTLSSGSMTGSGVDYVSDSTIESGYVILAPESLYGHLLKVTSWPDRGSYKDLWKREPVIDRVVREILASKIGDG